MRQFKAESITPLLRNLGFFFTVIVTLVGVMYVGQFPEKNSPYVPALSSQFYYEKSRITLKSISNKIGNNALLAILKTELPVLSIADRESEEQSRPQSRVWRKCLNVIAGIQLDNPLTYLKSEIPMMDVIPVTAAENYDELEKDEVTEKPSPAPSNQQELNITKVKNGVESDVPLIALYNTHTSESFEYPDGVSHIKGEAGGVSEVAKAIQNTIEQMYKIPVVYSSTIHDLQFNKSYAQSEKTVVKLLKENSKLQMLFDIHRDASLTREQCLAKVNGSNVAKVLIVVGTDARAKNPKWKENLTFARKIAAKMEAMYPGLSRGIAIKQGRYNQHLSTHALLVEIGSAKNSTDEAIASGKLFANVVVAVLNDMKAGK